MPFAVWSMPIIQSQKSKPKKSDLSLVCKGYICMLFKKKISDVAEKPAKPVVAELETADLVSSNETSDILFIKSEPTTMFNADVAA